MSRRLRLTEVVKTLGPCREGMACLRRALRGSPSLHETMRRHLAERPGDGWWVAAGLCNRVPSAREALLSGPPIAHDWDAKYAAPEHVIAWLDEYAGQLLAKEAS